MKDRNSARGSDRSASPAPSSAGFIDGVVPPLKRVAQLGRGVVGDLRGLGVAVVDQGPDDRHQCVIGNMSGGKSVWAEFRPTKGIRAVPK
jgi:hypothetical protein